MNYSFLPQLLLGVSISALIACSNSTINQASNDTLDDSSSSATVASLVGGALASSDTAGAVSLNSNAPKNIWSVLLFPQAQATNACPTFTNSSSSCSAASNKVTFTYNQCSFGSSTATWNGKLQVSSSSSDTLDCTGFPTIASGNSLQRQFVTNAGAPSTGYRINKNGVGWTVDNVTADIGRFDAAQVGELIPTTANIGSGFGTQIVFGASGVRTSVVAKTRIYSMYFDYSIDGTVAVTSDASGTRTLDTNGTPVRVFHNRLRLVGSSAFTSVVYDNTCCTPISGTIATTFAASGAAAVPPIAVGYVGRTETLTFNGCGKGSLTDAFGQTSDVTLSNCY